MRRCWRPTRLGRSPYRVVSDIGGPYAAMPPEAPGARLWPGYGPRLLPPHEVYTVLRESGFSPLGIPRQRGFVYTISVIDRGGDDGRLVIDARTGRILRFVPAEPDGRAFRGRAESTYGPPGPLPPTAGPGRAAAAGRRCRRSQAARRSGAACRSRAALPAKPAPRQPSLRCRPASPAAGKPSPQQAAAAPTKPADPQTTGTAAAAATAAAAVEAKPAPQILPTQDMPKAQGLE